MKTTQYIFGAICLCGIAFCQVSVVGPVPGPTPQRNMSSEEFNIKVIKHLLTYSTPLQNGNVQLHRMGDRAAGYILKILESRAPLSSAEEQIAVDIVHKAYEKPTVIVPASDRLSTSATLALLQNINDSTQDFSLKLRIADARQFILKAAFETP